MWSIMLLPNIPHYTLIENQCWRWQCAPSCGFYCAKECKFLVFATPFQINWASSVNWMSARNFSHGCSCSQNCICLAQSLSKRWCFEDDMNKNYYGAKFSVLVSVLHPLSRKVCIYLLDLCQNINFFYAMVFVFFICSWKGISLLQKPHMECILAYFSLVNILGILRTPSYRDAAHRVSTAISQDSAEIEPKLQHWQLASLVRNTVMA